MLRSGDILEERYTIQGPEPLGQGGMGKVWKARDQKAGVIVAIKEFEPDPKAKLDDEQKKSLQDLFVNEAELLAGLDYEAFPKVRDKCDYNQTPCIVMDYIPGEDFEKILKQKSNAPFEVTQVYDWTDQILEALNYLHNLPNPIIHKDIKPSNLKLTSNNRIRILDFGIAKGHIGEMTAPQFSIPLGTLNYAPLEQALKSGFEYHELVLKKHQNRVNSFINKKTVPQSDIFALCATVYRLLGGGQPQTFNAPFRASFVWNNEADPLPDLRHINSKIPLEFSDLIKKGMSLEIEDRFSSAAEMQIALKNFRENERQYLRDLEKQNFEDQLKSQFDHEVNELRINSFQKFREADLIIEKKDAEIEELKKSIEKLSSTSVTTEAFNRVQESADAFEKQLQNANNNLSEIKKQVIQKTASTFSQNLLDKLNGKSSSASDEFNTQEHFQKEFKLTVNKIEEVLRSNSSTHTKPTVDTIKEQRKIVLLASVYTLVLPIPIFIAGYFIWSIDTFGRDFKEKSFWLVPAVLLSLTVPILSSLIYFVGEKLSGTIVRSKVLKRYLYKFIGLLFFCGLFGAIAGLIIDLYSDQSLNGIMKGNFLGMIFGWLIFTLLFYRDLLRTKI